MERKELLGIGTSRDERTKEKVASRERYDGLLKALASFGSEVRRERTLEADPDIYPYTFVRNAVHEIIFPAQSSQLSDTADAGTIEGTAPYTLVRDFKRADCDESRVDGRVVVKYDDAKNTVAFAVEDGLVDKNSQLPPGVTEAIDRAFA